MFPKGVPRSGGVCLTETIRIFDRFGIEKNAETGDQHFSQIDAASIVWLLHFYAIKFD